MTDERRLTGWELEGHIKRLLHDGPPGKRYCVLCVAETLGTNAVGDYLEVANAIRRVGTYHPHTYETVPGKCEAHTGPSGSLTFWTIRKR